MAFKYNTDALVALHDLEIAGIGDPAGEGDDRCIPVAVVLGGGYSPAYLTQGDEFVVASQMSFDNAADALEPARWLVAQMCCA